MFNTDLAAAIAADITASAGAITAVEAGQEDAVAKFLSTAASYLGFGIGTVVSSGSGTTLTVTTGTTAEITSYVAGFTADNGKAGTIEFLSEAAVFPVGAIQYGGSTQIDGTDVGTVVGDSPSDPFVPSATTPALTRWTATIKVDGDDVDGTVDADEIVLKFTKLVK